SGDQHGRGAAADLPRHSRRDRGGRGHPLSETPGSTREALPTGVWATVGACVVVAAVLGALQAWDRRYAMNPDGISYLDVADAYLRGDWAVAVNGYWSPL